MKNTKLCTPEWYYLSVVRVYTVLWKKKSAHRKSVQSKIILYYLLRLEVYTHLFFGLHCHVDEAEEPPPKDHHQSLDLALVGLLNILPSFLSLNLLGWMNLGIFFLPLHVRRLQMNKRQGVCISVGWGSHEDVVVTR